MGRGEDGRQDLRAAQGVQIGDHNTQINVFGGTVTIEAPVTVTWPVRVGAVPLLADCYQERDEAPSLSEAVEAGGTAVLTQVLSGLGGVGKTQLAAAHARAHADVDLLVWMPAGSRNAVLTGYAECAARLGHRPAGDAEAAARWFLSWLQAESERSWLIVLDDLADPADLQGLWPDGTRGRTIVTTRRADAALTRSGRRRIDVGLFGPGQARAYLAAKLEADPAGERMREADELAADLGHLPLALAQAAAFMLDHGETCARYRSRLADRRRRLTELFPPDALADDYRATVAATWSISIDAADELHPRGLARPVLELLSVLDPHGAPLDLLGTQVVIAYATARSATPPRDAQDLTDALQHLARLSLVAVDPDGGPAAARVHGLVQRAAVEHLAPEHLDVLYEVAAGALLTSWPENERDIRLGQVLRSNATTMTDRPGVDRMRPGFRALLWRTGTSLRDWGLADAAMRHWEQMAAEAGRHLGPDDPSTLAIRGSAADARGEAGDHAGAAVAFEQLLTDHLRVLGPDHEDTLTTRNNLARCRGRSGDLAGAAAAFAQLLVDCRRVLGPDDPLTLGVRGNLAYWRGEAGDPVGAAGAFEELLADCLRVLGPDHPHTHSARLNLARWYGLAGNRAGGAAVSEQVLSDRLRDLGPDNPETLLARHNVAYSRGEAGDRAGAADMFSQLVADCLRVLGPDHPLTFAARQSAANLRGDAGDPAGAATDMGELVDDRTRVQGPDHVDTLVTRYRHTRLRADAGDRAGAAGALADLLADFARVLGPGHPHTLTVRHDLANARGDAGDPAGAVVALEQLLDDGERALAHDHPETLRVRYSLARWQADAGDRAAASVTFEQLLDDLLRVLGPDHSVTLSTRETLGKLRATSGDWPGAVAAFEHLLDDRVRLLGPDHATTLATRFLLAGLRGEAGDAAGAAQAFEELAAAQARVLGADHPDTLVTRQGAAHWRRKASER